ncbi:MAG: translation initiation factor IF-2 [Planctomycetota bacterium]|nr:translation initiation factor IF-2 [Planctomycetota bacterium]MDA1106531.1 translation initiation factor IF-2 [Planctomycetota bacterium]
MATKKATKTAGKTRVSQIAKEMGVESKAILDKCKSEGVDWAATHQSTLTVGQVDTIKQWFGASDAHTALESAESVDIEAVKVKRPSRRKAASKSADTGGGDSTTERGETATATAIAEPPAVPVPVVKAAPHIASAPASPPPVAIAVAPAVPIDAPAAVPAPVITAPAAPRKRSDDPPPAGRGPMAPTPVAPRPKPVTSLPPRPGYRPTMNVPDRPGEVRPAGEQLQQPTRTQLSGPRVVRVEAADDLPKPVRRSPPGGAISGPGGAGSRNFTGGSGTGGRSFGDRDLAERNRRLQGAAGFFDKHRRGTAARGATRGPRPAVVKPSGPIKVSEPFTIKDLSAATGVKVSDILGKLLMAGGMSTINSPISAEKATEVMMEFEIELEVTEAKSAEDEISEHFAARERKDPRPRAPVVTILGHVDHGKTSLLDRIRKADVAAGEAGGITQATSAFSVPVRVGEKDRTITFIDTPGHEAFTAMRARGARVTDIAVLVVAADDGVMPQTVESINHAKAAKVPVVVVLNKIDRAEATEKNLQRIYGQLAEHGLNTVPWGGDVEVVPTSATKGTGIETLLETLDLVADMAGLEADFAGFAEGTVLEAQMEEGRGVVARVLVQEGVLRKGDYIVVGRAAGRIRDIVNDRGQRVMEASPSTPVAISGLDMLPDAGDKLYSVKDMKAAEAAAKERRVAERQRELAAPKITLDNILDHIARDKSKELPLVVKADVQGSVETLRALLGKLKEEEISISVKHCSVGGINESDVLLAQATGAIVIGFNVTTNSKARQLAEAKGVDIRLYEVIYHLTEDMQKAMRGKLEPEIKLQVLGHADVRQVFKISRVGAIAGCYVTDGVVERNAQIRVTRDGIVIEKDRRLEQLKRFKEDAKEIRTGNECGMKIDGYDDIRVGDVLECYKSVKVERGEGSHA